MPDVLRNRIDLWIKRCLDVATSLLLLLVLWPVLFTIVVLIRGTSSGPAIFRQERIGQHGRRFILHKFRTMYDGTESDSFRLQAHNEMSGPAFKMRNDPRVTPLGRFLRRYSLDELPQLWDVLRGRMSLVGPRPLVVSDVARYQAPDTDRLRVRPGMTGPWQVSGRNDLDFDEWMRLDLAYVRNWSLREDLRILLKTIPAVMTGRGAR